MQVEATDLRFNGLETFEGLVLLRNGPKVASEMVVYLVGAIGYDVFLNLARAVGGWIRLMKLPGWHFQ